MDAVDHAGGRGDQIKVVFAGQAFLDDLEMEQAEEAAAEAEAERCAAFGFEAEAGVVEAQAADGFAQLFEVGRVHREQPAEHHRLDHLEPGERLQRAVLDRGDRVPDLGLGDFLDLRGDEADFAGAELGQLLQLGGEAAGAVDQVFGAAGHEFDREALLDHPVDHADEDDDAEVGIVPAIDQHRFQRRIAVALGGRDAGDHGFEHFGDADPGFGAGEHGLAGVEADHLLDFGADLFGFGGGQVDLVDDGHDLVVVLDRLVDIGEGLGLDPLRGVNHQQRAFASGEGAADFVGEIDVAGGVHQVELIGQPVLGGVAEADRLGLDGDPALFLNVHVIKDLRRHLTLSQPPGVLDQPIRQRALPMVDMGDNRKVAYQGQLSHRAPLAAQCRAVSSPFRRS